MTLNSSLWIAASSSLKLPASALCGHVPLRSGARHAMERQILSPRGGGSQARYIRRCAAAARYGYAVEEVVRIPVGGRGLDAAAVGAALGDDLALEQPEAGGRSVDMDPATATLVVGLATAVPSIISAVAAAWSRFRRPSQASAALVIETTGQDVVIRVGEDGTVAPADVAALPESPRQILRIHLR